MKPEIAPPHAVDEGPVVNPAIVTKERKPVCAMRAREQIGAKVIQSPKAAAALPVNDVVRACRQRAIPGNGRGRWIIDVAAVA